MPREQGYILLARFAFDADEQALFGNYGSAPRYLNVNRYYDGSIRWSFDIWPIEDKLADTKLADSIRDALSDASQEMIDAAFDTEALNEFIKYLKGEGLASASDLKKQYEAIEITDDAAEEDVMKIRAVVDSLLSSRVRESE